MTTYIVQIKETVIHEMEVQADSEFEALTTAENEWGEYADKIDSFYELDIIEEHEEEE